MDNRTLAIIGLIGGILAAVGVFGTWTTASITPVMMEGMELSASGWDWAQGTVGAGGPGLKLPYFALVGGILAVVGSVLVLVKPGAVAKVLLAIGGILALIGVAIGVAYADAGTAITGAAPGISAGAGYGAYMVVIGGILAILVTLGLK